MSLAKLMEKQILVLLGLNSGTSADGIDMAALRIERTKKTPTIRFIKGQSARYPASLRSRILNLADSQSTTLEEIISLDNTIGNFFGQKASSFIKQLDKSGIKVDAVASHGQTVRHIPRSKKKLDRGTLQFGSIEMISTATGKPAVGDFRQADVALGNEGAPITVAAMQKLFGSNNESRLIVNIGGISNYFYFPKNKKMSHALAGDCGPGNSLCDILSEKLFKTKFDKNGKIARSGKPSKRILSLLLAEPFFRSSSVSTGREAFGQELAAKIVTLGQKFGLSNEDIVSTAAELTVLSVTHKVNPLIKKDKQLKNLYLTGGGRKNKFFVMRLSQLLNGVEISSADQLGFNADYIEAAAYAVMGESALRSEPLNTKFNGKNPDRVIPVLGKIVQPPIKR